MSVNPSAKITDHLSVRLTACKSVSRRSSPIALPTNAWYFLQPLGSDGNEGGVSFVYGEPRYRHASQISPNYTRGAQGVMAAMVLSVIVDTWRTVMIRVVVFVCFVLTVPYLPAFADEPRRSISGDLVIFLFFPNLNIADEDHSRRAGLYG